MRYLSCRTFGAFLGLVSVMASPLAQGETLQWGGIDPDTGVAYAWPGPATDPDLNALFTIDPGDPAKKIAIDFSFPPGTNCVSDCTDFLGANPPAAGFYSPALNTRNTGGLNPAQKALYIATDYVTYGDGNGQGDPTAPAVSVTFEFNSFENGVGNVEFTIFDLDASVGFHDDVTVTALVQGSNVPIDPTEITSGADNQIYNDNSVSGVPGSGTPSTSGDANATFRFAQNGIKTITVIYRNIIAPPPMPMAGDSPGFQSISISDIQYERSPAAIVFPVSAFDNTTIVGKVFNDLNADGWQDPGEDGVPGVRLITPDGLLIETDAEGRYHIAAVDGGFVDRGRNFIVKVDPATLPRDTTFTTENPRQQRITRGMLNRFDFGVRLPGEGPCCEEVELKLSELFFETGRSELRPEYTRVLRQFADLLRDQGGGLITIGGNALLDELGPRPRAPIDAREYTLTPHFDDGQAILRFEDRAALDRIAADWRGVEDIRVEAVGHTSNTPVGAITRQRFADNYVLSQARAAAVANYLRNALGLVPQQIAADGRGPDQPVASNATLDGQARNRRVELRITGLVRGAVPAFDDPATKLAEDRAKQVYLALKGLLGAEMVRSVDFRFADDPAPTPAGKRCGLEPCIPEPLYAFELLTGKSKSPAPDDTRYARTDDRRVDVRGMFTVSLAGGGVLSATEDPVVVEPRLAVLGPETLPFADGRIAATSVFHFYMNYPAFIHCAELLVYRGDDTDLIRPLARMPIPITTFGSISWDGYTGRERLRGNDQLIYFAKVCDEAGHIDTTAAQSISLVSEKHYVAASRTRLVPEPQDAAAMMAVLPDDTPLSGNVLVFQPTLTEPVEALDYTFRARFDTRKTALKPEARQELDRIAEQWRGAGNIRVEAIGHTDSIRIAPQHRNEFANNQVLSEARASVVAEYVADKLGLSRDRISTAGRGPSEPVADNGSIDGRALNRRVELRITGDRTGIPQFRQARVALVDPGSGAEELVAQSLVEAKNVLAAKRDIAAATDDSVSPLQPAGARAMPPLVAQASAEALASLYGRNDLEQQNIPIYGSRVRVRGRDIAASHGLRIETVFQSRDQRDERIYSQAVPLDADGEFAAEFLMPLGMCTFYVEFLDVDGEVLRREPLMLPVTGEHMFAVAMVDLTLSNNDITGRIEPVPADSRYKDDFLTEGRVAFYLKGRVKGKYLVTAQLDTQEEQLDNLLGNLDKKDSRAIFRRIDPDLYYPVYGDDSTTISDTDSQGRLYARVEWDRSEALWGNFHTDFTGNEFAHYNRSLYGGQVHYRSIDTTGLGEPEIEGRLFASEAQTALGHVEFVGTAGSLYYLKHSDVLQGSDKARVELRDRDSGRVIANQALQREVDYEIDEFQGRIILSRPLPSTTNMLAPGLIRETPLDGHDVVLIVDYEYVPNGFDTNQLTTGARGKYWLNENLAVGGTWVDESRPGENYSLLGGDLTLQLGRGTFLKAEYADSEATQTGRFGSADGGLSFSPLLNAAQGRSGDAYGIEGRANFAEWLGTQREWIAAAWWRRTDDNFSVARRDTGVDTVETGVELTGDVSERLSVAARYSSVELGTDEIMRFGLQADYELGQRATVSGELRTEERNGNAVLQGDSTVGAIRYGHRIAPDIELYGIGQFTIDKDSLVSDNDLLTLGATAQILNDAQLQGEYSTGDRGNSTRVGFDYTLNALRHIYGTYTHSTDRTDPFGGNQAVIGQRSQISDQTEVFTESQFTNRDEQAGLAHVFGLNFLPRPGWKIGIGIQNGEVVTDGIKIDRDAASVSAAYHSLDLLFGSKIEYRQDKGGSELEQWLTSNRVDLKLSDDLRLLAKLNFSATDDPSSNAGDASFVEGSIGAAFRPAAHDRLNILSKYTYLSDLRAPEQIIAGTDQRSHIVTGEFVYRINTLWDLGSKLGWRSSELRSERSAGEWTQVSTNFAAVRGTFHVLRRWDGIAEFRVLDADNESQLRKGFLIEIDRHFGQHLKLGLGYNFTEFSDDLTNPDFDARGFFLNATGKY